jgi:MFS family permease
MTSKPILSNIKRNYLYIFIVNAGLSQAIWMLYLAYRGMSLIEIGLLESIFHITSMTMEIPTGLIADRFGRKTSRLLSSVMAFASACMMLSAHSFTMLAFGFVLSALSYNLESGAGDALVYDSLIQGDQESRYYKIRGFQEIAFQSARGVGMIVGGFVAQTSYELAYGITAAMHVIAFLISTGFIEPTVGKREVHLSLSQIIKESIHTLKTTTGVVKFMILSEVFGLFYTSQFFYFQNFLKELGYREGAIGLFLAGATLFGIIGSNAVDGLQKRYKQDHLLIGLFIIGIVGFFGISFTQYEPYFMMLLSGAEGAIYVLFSGLINERIPSEQRATLLSFQSMIFSVLMILWFPIMGLLCQSGGFKLGFRSVFVLAAVSLGVFLISILRKGRN